MIDNFIKLVIESTQFIYDEEGDDDTVTIIKEFIDLFKDSDEIVSITACYDSQKRITMMIAFKHNKNVMRTARDAIKLYKIEHAFEMHLSSEYFTKYNVVNIDYRWNDNAIMLNMIPEEK